MSPSAKAAVCAATLLTILVARADAAQTVSHVVAFDPADMAISQVDGFDLIEIRDDQCALEGNPGEPFLPVRNVHILLPPGTRAVEARAVVIEEVPLEGVFRVYPAQPDVPVSEAGPYAFVEPDAQVYASETALPQPVAALVDTVLVRGFHVAVLQVRPFSYVPASGAVTLRSRIRLALTLERFVPPGALRLRGTSPVFERLVSEKALNPEATVPSLTATPIESPVDAGDVQYLLIGDPDHFDEFQPLLEWKTKKGAPAEAVSVDWIYATYPGADNQEKIKYCIKDYVENKGTVWVVLAGDNSIVPDRDCHGEVGSSYVTNTIPTDLYYAGLDDMDWDDDNDGIAAEVGDDTIDMGPDVIVGRLPIRTEVQAAAVVAKALQYEKNIAAANFAEKMLLSGVRLWNTGDAEAKSESMWDGWIDPYWNGVHYRFYDTATDFAGGAAYAVSPANLDAQLANGHNFLHTATHGSNTSWGMESGGGYSSSWAGAVNNPDRYTNIGTIACHSNAFDAAEPSLSEAFIRNPNGGAVSFFGSSRYGWGITTLSSHGTSFRYDRMFYQFLFDGEPTTYPQHLGAVFTKMKEYSIGSCNYNGSMRWCQFSINLMGDPEMPLYTRDPQTFSPSFAPAIPAGPQTFVVDTGVPGAQVCLMKDTEVYAYGEADALGQFSAVIFPVTSGTLDVTITAADYRPYEGSTLVVLESAGILTIEETVCSANDLLHVNVVDLDLKGAGAQNVLFGTDGGDSETLSLLEIAASTGVFSGTIPTDSGVLAIGDGQLQVNHGETITGTYNDVDDGTGSPAVDQDTALVDALAPVISNVQVNYITRKSAIITFDTDEISTGRIRCGTAAGGSYPIIGRDSGWGTAHTVYLDGLAGDSWHYFQVEAADIVQNVATNNNAGSDYSFKTVSSWTVPFFDDFESGNVDKWEINVDGWGSTPYVAADSTLVGGLTPISGSYVASLGDKTESGSSYATMDLVIDLAGLDWVELSFWWVTANLESYKYIRLDIWDGEWHQNVGNLAYNGTAWEKHTLDLSRFRMIDGFVIRFYTYQSTPENTDAAYVDDVRVVVPDSMTVTPREAFLSSGPPGGPFTPVAKTYVLENSGGVPIDWTAATAAPWLDVSPAAGSALAPGATTTVTLSPNAAATGYAPGVYPDSVRFMNTTTGYSQAVDSELSVESYAILPFFEDFEDSSPTLKSYWRTTGTGNYRSQVSDTFEPYAGAYHFVMDKPDYTINYARNELTLGIDLAGYRDVELSFWARCFGYDPQGPPPSPFVNGADFDGVAISENGATWYEARGLRDCAGGAWEHIVVDLDTAIAAHGLSYNSQFKIRFNVYGRYPATSDGLALDDIRIDAEVIDDMEVSPRTLFIASGQESGPFIPAATTYTLTNTGTAALEWTATSSVSWLDAVPASGSLDPGTSATVHAAINSNADTLSTGTYPATIFFTNTTTGNARWRDLELSVKALQPPPSPSAPSPPDGYSAAGLEPDLAWTCGMEGIWNGGFESGDFRGWTTLAGPGWGAMPWDIGTSGTGMMGNNFPVEGLRFAENGFEGNAGYSYQIFQEVGIPDAAGTARLEWAERIQWNNWDRLPSQRRRYTVAVQPAGGGSPLATLYTTDIDTTTTGDTGYVHHAVDLLSAAPQLAGRVARVHFREDIPTDWPGWATFDLDGVSLALDGPSNAMFDVYFDTVNPPMTRISSGLASPVCDPGVLADSTTYYWQVIASNAAGTTTGPIWSFTTSPPEIGCSPTSFSVVCSEGGAIAMEDLVVWNQSPPGGMDYSITAAPAWLSVSAPTGHSTGETSTHTVSVDPVGLAPGDHAGTITIHATGATNNPVSHPVSLKINDVAPGVRIDSILPDPAQPPAAMIEFRGRAADGAGTIKAIEWRSDLDGLLSAATTFSLPSTALTVGAHNVTLTAWDDEGTSATDAGTLAVFDAAPTASIGSLNPNPVEAGETVTILLAGQDNDELGQALLEAELAWPGQTLDLLPGTHSLAAPATRANYPVSYRVRDDEGTWSAPAFANLRVVEPSIGVSATSLTLEADENAGLTTRSLSISNATPPGTLTYDIVTTPACLVCQPTTGSSTGEAVAHTLAFDPSNMDCGDYAATITIRSLGAFNSPVAVPILLRVNDVRPAALIVGGPSDPLQPPLDIVSFTGAGTDGYAVAARCEWRSDIDGLLSDSDSFSSSSFALTVGEHRIAFSVWDDEGGSATVSTTMTIRNASPTATIVSVSPPVVAAGATVNFEVSAQDNDERGGTIEDGELVGPGGTLSGILPGTHAVVAPAIPGIYSFEYRVRDDEGEWSPPARTTVEVLGETSARQWMLYF